MIKASSSIGLHLRALSRAVCALALLMPELSLAATEGWGDLRILSAAGDPLNAEIETFHRHKNIDATCFSVKSLSPHNPVILDFTPTTSLQGTLRLWTSQPLAGDTRVTLLNRCEYSQLSLTITPDNEIVTATSDEPVKTSEDNLTNSSAMPLDTISAPLTDVNSTPGSVVKSEPRPIAKANTPDNNLEPLLNELMLLREQLASFKQQLSTLYQDHITQGEVLKQLQSELVIMRKENDWLRTIALSLVMTLLISSYFFADWLRRKAASTALEESTRLSNDQILTPSAISASTSPANVAEISDAKPTAPEDAFIAPAFSKKLTVPILEHARSEPVLCAPSIIRLQQHLNKHPKQSPRVWLYLLDKLKHEGQQSAYEVAAENCRKYFNIQIESFDGPKHRSSSVSLESFPRLCETLQTIWGTAETLSFIDDLVYNTRLVPRIGFQREVFEELLMLRDIALQTLQIQQPAASPQVSASKDNNLKILSKLEDEISDLPSITPSAFQYWSEFTFELDEFQPRRKMA